MTLSNLPGVRTPHGGVVETVKVELGELHERWMGLVFPRQRTSPDAVLGKWRPGTSVGRLEYGLWGALGYFVVLAGYALGLVGSPIRSAVRRIGRLAETWGLPGAAFSAAVPGMAATAAAWLSAGRPGATLLGVAAAATVVLVAAGTLLARFHGRAARVLVAYPLGIIAIGLVPAVLAGLVEPGATARVVAGVDAVAVGVPVALAGGRPLPTSPVLLGIAYVGVAVPAGWAIGLLVTVADLARPLDAWATGPP